MPARLTLIHETHSLKAHLFKPLLVRKTKVLTAADAVTCQHLTLIFVLKVTRRDTHLKSLSRRLEKHAFHSSARTTSNRSRYSLAHGLEHVGRTPFSIVKGCFLPNEPRLQHHHSVSELTSTRLARLGDIRAEKSRFCDLIGCQRRSGVVNLALTRSGMENSITRSHHHSPRCNEHSKCQSDSAG